MSKGQGKRKTEKGDARGGMFFLAPQCLLSSEAFRTASPRAIQVLWALCAKHNGFNNGAIALGCRDLAEWLGCQNHAAHQQALCELQERGLIELTRTYPKGQRLANEYRLTFVSVGDTPATNEYLGWKPGDAGTRRTVRGGNFRVEAIATRSAERVAMTATGEEISRCDDRNACHAKPPNSASLPVAITSTHIGKPFEGLDSSANKSPQNTGGPPVAPDAETLRSRVLAVLDRAERGSQGQLAALAQVRPAALSKFLHNSGTLNDQARIRLTLALPKIAAPTLQAA